MMKPLLIGVLGLTLMGCSSARYKSNAHDWNTTRRSTMNQWMVQDLQDESIRNAVISAHTLYDHHFVANAADLNELGERDLGMLGAHYADHPGALSVRRGRASAELHAARVQVVRDTLAGHGVELERVSVDDRLPGGDGMAGSMVLRILDEKMDQPLSEDRAASGSFTGGGSSQ